MAEGQLNKSNPSYEKYKAKLNDFFDGKAKLSKSFLGKSSEPEKKAKRRLSPAPVFSYDIFIEAIKRSTTPDEITRTVNALLESGHQIPNDDEILSKCLIHRDDTLVLTALQKLQDFLANQESKHSRLLKTRLENLLLISSSSEVKELATLLIEKL